MKPYAPHPDGGYAGSKYEGGPGHHKAGCLGDRLGQSAYGEGHCLHEYLHIYKHAKRKNIPL